MKFRLILIAPAILLLMLAACGPAPELRNDKFLRDASFLSEEPCGPPCWRGITPGETSWSDALTIIEDDATLDDLQTQADEENGTEAIGASWRQTDGEGCCLMITEDGETVHFLVLQTAPLETLGEVIEKWGEPTYAVGESFTDDQTVISLFYPDIPMLIYAFKAGETAPLTDASEIIGFGYFAPEQMDTLLASSSLHTWDGYEGDYMGEDFEVTPEITATPESE